MRTIALSIGAAFGPFAVATAFLLATKGRTGLAVLVGWLVAIAVGDGIGALCLQAVLPGKRRRLAVVLVYVPLMLGALVVYTFFYTGSVLGRAA